MSSQASPFLIVGLGNPGRAYRRHRHNVGFMVLDLLSEAIGQPFSKRRMEALVADGRLQDHKVILAKPQTYMNLSGRSVASLWRYFRIPTERLLVISDDLDLPLGTLRLRPMGGAGGQKGLASIIEHLGTQQFPRLRIGIGRPPGRVSPTDYVLQEFSDEEITELEIILRTAKECVQVFVQEGINTAMTRFNENVE